MLGGRTMLPQVSGGFSEEGGSCYHGSQEASLRREDHATTVSGGFSEEGGSCYHGSQEASLRREDHTTTGLRRLL